MSVKKKLVFVCAQNRIRSCSAERLFNAKFSETLSSRSVGTDDNAVVKISERHLMWADIVFVMEQKHKKIILKRFPKYAETKQIIVLGLEDIYDPDEPELLNELERRVMPHLANTIN